MIRKVWNAVGPDFRATRWHAWPVNSLVLPGIHRGMKFNVRQIVGGGTWSLAICTKMSLDE